MKKHTKNTNENEIVIAVISEFLVVEKTSKNGNRYKCIVGIDNTEKEHFICYAK